MWVIKHGINYKTACCKHCLAEIAYFDNEIKKDVHSNHMAGIRTYIDYIICPDCHKIIKLKENDENIF
jgi:hypothetical protein